MTKKEHTERHKLLYDSFDELLVDWLAQTKKLPSESPVLELMDWAYEQAINPTEVTP